MKKTRKQHRTHPVDKPGPRQMIFWSYDQFPWVLWGLGRLRDNGTARVTAYNVAGYSKNVRPVKVLDIAEGRKVADGIQALAEEHRRTLESVHSGFNARLALIAPFTRP